MLEHRGWPWARLKYTDAENFHTAAKAAIECCKRALAQPSPLHLPPPPGRLTTWISCSCGRGSCVDDAGNEIGAEPSVRMLRLCEVHCGCEYDVSIWWRARWEKRGNQGVMACGREAASWWGGLDKSERLGEAFTEEVKYFEMTGEYYRLGQHQANNDLRIEVR